MDWDGRLGYALPGLMNEAREGAWRVPLSCCARCSICAGCQSVWALVVVCACVCLRPTAPTPTPLLPVFFRVRANQLVGVHARSAPASLNTTQAVTFAPPRGHGVSLWLPWLTNAVLRPMLAPALRDWSSEIIRQSPVLRA
jgi:hypothetical protein